MGSEKGLVDSDECRLYAEFIAKQHSHSSDRDVGLGTVRDDNEESGRRRRRPCRRMYASRSMSPAQVARRERTDCVEAFWVKRDTAALTRALAPNSTPTPSASSTPAARSVSCSAPTK